ncbi:MAG: ABC transporter permease [Planctomycetes bacterium]|nr:ABC transporter permease [Planctomycetota bacterium]
MLFWTIVKVAFKSLAANKLRSFLAMLGIIIGVGAVISMMAIGSGAQAQVLARFSAMGTNLLVIRPGQRGSGGVMSGTQLNLKLDDADAMLKEAEGIGAVAPVVSGSSQVKYLSRNTRTNVLGSSTTYFTIRTFEIDKGRTFTEAEVDRHARVAVIGPVTATNLFGEDDAVGEIIKVKGINFQVIGVMKSKGDQGYFNPDDQVIVPYTTAMKQLFGLDYLREIDIQAADEEKLADVQESVKQLLRKRHRLQADTPDDFSIQNQAELLEARSSATKTFGILLGSVGAISLLVGGIGIMNIMLVTVTERTREIGVRKAIGAKNRHILLQFLIEAMIMSAVGGVIGVGVGVGAAHVVGDVMALQEVVETFSVILALTFSVGVGIFFGFYPACRASHLDPIEALRYE